MPAHAKTFSGTSPLEIFLEQNFIYWEETLLLIITAQFFVFFCVAHPVHGQILDTSIDFAFSSCLVVAKFENRI